MPVEKEQPEVPAMSGKGQPRGDGREASLLRPHNAHRGWLEMGGNGGQQQRSGLSSLCGLF